MRRRNRGQAEAHVESRLRFLGEQEGPIELELTAQLRREFTFCREVGRAYLARVSYDDKAPVHVGLCLRAPQADEQRIVKLVLEVFARLFSSDTYLDIIFLSVVQERELRQMCRPFYAVD